ADIIAIHRSMKDVALAKSVGQITTASATVDRYERMVYKSFELVSQRFLGDKSDVKTAQLAFSEWKAIRDEVIRLMELGKKEQAADITKAKGAEHVEDMNQKIQVMIDFASNKGNSFFKKSKQDSQLAIYIMIILLVITLATSVIVAIVITLSIITPLTQIVEKIKNVAKGELSQKIEISCDDEIGELARSTYSMIGTLADVVVQTNKIAEGDYKTNIVPHSKKDKLGVALQKMTKTLRKISAENQQQNWFKTGQTELNEVMRGDLDIVALSHKIINYIAKYLQVQVGTLYLYEEKVLRLKASYAYNQRKGLNNEFKLGEGLIGQAALELEMLMITDIPEDYIHIVSGTGYTIPRYIIVVPIVYENTLKGVIELASLQPFSTSSQQFLTIITENIAISITSAQSRNKMSELLAQSQQQAEELTAQQEELRATN
ncbi:MAG: GAF domain-containing protein, partial [Proteobacteria bacterium]|nr:GAF domain-containing protein [Pseudomonadota bacterium]